MLHALAAAAASWTALRLTPPAAARPRPRASPRLQAALASAPPESLWNARIKDEWMSAYASYSGPECAYEISEVEGTIPSDVVGTVWRNGPGNFERGGRRFNHILDGDGLICRISIDGGSGRATFRSAFVRTAAFEAEEAADAVLHRNTFGTQRDGVLANAGRLVLKNVANTNVIRLGSKLLALWEAGLPTAMERTSMATVGPDLLGGALREGMTVTTGFEAADSVLGLGQAFTAHPRTDPRTGRLVGFAWAAAADQSYVMAQVLELDQKSGAVVQRTPVRLEGAIAPHDFAMTPEYYVFLHNGMGLDVLPFVAGTKGPVDCLRTTGGGVTVQLVPRPGGSRAGTPPIVARTDDPWFNIHHATACDDGEGVTVLTAGWPRVQPGPFLGDWGGDTPSYDDGQIQATRLYEVTIRPDGSGGADVSRAAVAGGACIDHPHVDPRFDGSERCRFVYMSFCNPGGEHGSGSPYAAPRVEPRPASKPPPASALPSTLPPAARRPSDLPRPFAGPSAGRATTARAARASRGSRRPDASVRRWWSSPSGPPPQRRAAVPLALLLPATRPRIPPTRGSPA